MKTKFLTLLLLLKFTISFGQQEGNIFIITIDGLRWQEVYNGADSSLINNTRYVKDTGLIKQIFWSATKDQRREKLFPFFWNVIAQRGQLYGNREFDNKVSVKNIYKISYPGYNEILSGFADWLPVFNKRLNNRNQNILEVLNHLPEYENKVAAFTSWDLFPYILNSKKSKFLINSGYLEKKDINKLNSPVDQVQEAISIKGEIRYDLLTFLKTKEYIILHHPKVVFISFGETDEAAHKKNYDEYLRKAKDIDGMLSELWYLIQTDSFYKNNTTLLITTDHGRGKKENTWFNHNSFIKGSGETWLALLGKNIEAR